MLGIIILITHYANLHGKLCLSDAAWGLAILIAISLLSIKIKEAILCATKGLAYVFETRDGDNTNTNL